METSKLHYLLIVSEHNLPNLLSVLALREIPNQLYLVVTPRFKDKAKKFESVLRYYHSNIHITYLCNNPLLDGESYQHMRQWCLEELLPLFNKSVDTNWILNVTGGTKLMAIVLENAISWDEIHYKALLSRYVQCWNKKNNTFHNLPVSPVCVKDVIKLYSEIRPHPVNPVDGHQQSADIAEKIWHHYAGQANNPWLVLHQYLCQIWRAPEDNLQKYIKISRKDINDDCDWEDLKKWCQLISRPAPGAIKIKKSSIDIATASNKPYRKWIKWIQGLWLETLVHRWLQEKYSNDQVAANIFLESAQRELDFVVLNQQHQLCIIEAKVAPGTTKNSDIIRQITSVDILGNLLTRILVISPFFFNDMNRDKISSFRQSCKENRIILCESKQELFQALEKHD